MSIFYLTTFYQEKRGVSTGFCQLPLRLRRRYSVLFSIYFLGVSAFAPNMVAESAAMIARISICQDVSW
tara:strand:- start:330 stop:536 length:207 start_codon:yes stop_codon:yes gene_type:complete